MYKIYSKSITRIRYLLFGLDIVIIFFSNSEWILSYFNESLRDVLNVKLNCNFPVNYTTRCVGSFITLRISSLPHYNIIKYCYEEVICMWKYTYKKQCNEFLLSLRLIDDSHKSDQDKLKKIYAISNSIVKNYDVFTIRKRNGKSRIIYSPSVALKQIQRQILKNVLYQKHISKCATAYHKDATLRKNASVHVGKPVLLKLDIEDFFSSITFDQVLNTCFSLAYFPYSLGILLTTLCTYFGFLPQGAPTSSAISNLVMKEFDEELGQFCETLNISYTRYSDDMTFSGEFDPKIVINKVRKMLKMLGMKLNLRKIRVITSSSSQSVTGIVVNEKLQVSSNYRKRIRQEIYYIKKFGLASHLQHLKIKDKVFYLKSLYGRICYVLQIDSDNLEFLGYREFLRHLN